MTKFHINSEGNAGPCIAEIRDCRFGGQSDHFETAEAAQLEAEKRFEETHGATAKPLKKIRHAFGKAVRALEGFAEGVDARHERDMEEIRDLDRQRRINKAGKRSQ